MTTQTNEPAPSCLQVLTLINAATIPRAASASPARGYHVLDTTFGRPIEGDALADTAWCLHLRDRTPGRNSSSEMLAALVARAVAGVRSGPDDKVDMDFAPFGAANLGVDCCHLLLEPTPDCLLVMDLGSRQGSWLDDRPLLSGRLYRLVPGQVLVLAGLHLEIIAITPARQ